MINQIRLLLLGAVLGLTARGGPPPEPGVLVRGQRLPVIDVHQAQVTIELTTDCVAANWFYPPAPDG